MVTTRTNIVERGASSAAGAGRVLIVENEAIVALDFQERVSRLGYQVVGITGRAADAVCKAIELRPDVVLMDVRLQGEMDGADAAMLIHRTQDTPIIFITAFGDVPTLQKVVADSPSGFLLKPVDDRELEVALRAARLHEQAIRSLRKGQAWLAAVLQGVPDGVIATGGDGRIRYFNPTAEQLTVGGATRRSAPRSLRSSGPRPRVRRSSAPFARRSSAATASRTRSKRRSARWTVASRRGASCCCCVTSRSGNGSSRGRRSSPS